MTDEGGTPVESKTGRAAIERAVGGTPTHPLYVRLQVTVTEAIDNDTAKEVRERLRQDLLERLRRLQQMRADNGSITIAPYGDAWTEEDVKFAVKRLDFPDEYDPNVWVQFNIAIRIVEGVEGGDLVDLGEYTIDQIVPAVKRDWDVGVELTSRPIVYVEPFSQLVSQLEPEDVEEIF